MRASDLKLLSEAMQVDDEEIVYKEKLQKVLLLKSIERCT